MPPDADGLADDEPTSQVEERLRQLLARQLDQVVARRVPVRGVTAGPREGVTRLRLGDGTAILVRSEQAGSLGQVLQQVTAGRSVVVDRCERHAVGLRLWLALPLNPRRLVCVVVLGPDQPD